MGLEQFLLMMDVAEFLWKPFSLRENGNCRLRSLNSSRRTALLLAEEPGVERSGSQKKRPAAERLRGQAATLLVAVLGLCGAAGAQMAPRVDDLPDAPSALMSQQVSESASQQVSELADDDQGATKTRLRPCRDSDYPKDNLPLQGPPPCMPENPIQSIVTSEHVQPLTSQEKGTLAIKDFLDPFNFVTIAGYSAIVVGTNSHTAYGSGFNGFAKLTGYGLAEDAQGEFLQTYAISSLTHEDPRYHRMPSSSVKRRIWHAIEHTYVARRDDGRSMPNYATLLTYPISAELCNLYVPGIQTDARSTTRRMVIGIGTDPAGAIVAEFLPDVARRIHIHILFVQEILNAAILGSPSTE
jgi:hypothetical protein